MKAVDKETQIRVIMGMLRTRLIKKGMPKKTIGEKFLRDKAIKILSEAEKAQNE